MGKAEADIDETGSDSENRIFRAPGSGSYDFEDATESPSRFRRYMVALGAGATALVLAGGIGFVKGESSKDDELTAARAETRAALALGQAGYDNIVSLETAADSTLLAELSLNPDDPQACSLAFIVKKDPVQLVLTQQDSAGTFYGEKVTSNAADTAALMAEECKLG